MIFAHNIDSSSVHVGAGGAFVEWIKFVSIACSIIEIDLKILNANPSIGCEKYFKLMKYSEETEIWKASKIVCLSFSGL